MGMTLGKMARSFSSSMSLSRRKQAQLATAWLVLREACRAFSADRNLQTAATLAYYGFLALMPFFLLVIHVLSAIMESSESVQEGMRQLTERLFPSFSDALLGDLLRLSRQKTWGAVSIVVLLWSMTPFAGALRHTFVRIFKTERKLSYLKGKLLDMGAVLSLLACFVFLVAVNMLHFVKTGTLFPQNLWVVAAVKSVFLFAFTVVVLMGFEYVFIPIRLPASLLLAGAVVGTSLVGAMRPLFDIMLRYNPNYGYAFGSLKAIFVLIIWVYYTFAVLLLSGEVVAAMWRKDALLLKGFLSKTPPLSRTTSALLDRFVRPCEPGEELFREGDRGSDMFYVLGGAVKLTKGNVHLRSMGPGEYFGEMSMLSGAPRTATATATVDTQLITISQNNFETILRENPGVVLEILKEMASRLRMTNEQIKSVAHLPAPSPRVDSAST